MRSPVVLRAMVAVERADARAVERVNRSSGRAAVDHLELEQAWTVMTVCRVVATQWEVDVDDLFGPGRAQPLALARQVAMCLVREFAGLSSVQTGRIFKRDHSTVLYAGSRLDPQLLYRVSEEVERALSPEPDPVARLASEVASLRAEVQELRTVAA